VQTLEVQVLPQHIAAWAINQGLTTTVTF
jgi:hypothetical protein